VGGLGRDRRIEVLNPATEEVIAQVAAGTPADVDRAVAAARRALPAWSARPPGERADYLEKAHEALVARTDEIAALISRDMGMPLRDAASVQVGLPAFNLANFARLARSFTFDGPEVGNSLIVREPIGVVGCITPWNFPLHQIVLKVAAALAAGCTVVVKPTEVAPLAGHALASIFDDVGLPAGVSTCSAGSARWSARRWRRIRGRHGVVHRLHPGREAGRGGGGRDGQAGRSGARREVGQRAARRCRLRAGGSRRPGQVLHQFRSDLLGADPDAGAGRPAGRGGADRRPGGRQVPARRSVRPGTRLGPLVSSVQLERVRSYIQKGIDEGATLVVGGVESGRDRPTWPGYYVPATVFSGVTPEMTIAREEIFGPVLSIMPYQDEDDAVRIANDTEYGLAGGVWSADPERALRVARRLRAGQIEVNGGAFNPGAPFGGYKQSGVGREGGAQDWRSFWRPRRSSASP
jgi:betaine-aldehyde dehydrogenase